MPVAVRNVLVALACTPLLVLLVLLAAIRLPWMDAVTVRMPMGIRAAVATVIVNRTVSYKPESRPGLERAVRLDPANAIGWQRLCWAVGSGIERRAVACRHAIEVSPTPWNYKALAELKEEQKDWSGAEETMRIAQSKADTIDNDPALFLRELGRLEMVNGHLDKSLVDLTRAEKFDARDAEFAKNDDGDAADAVETDREYLIVLYDRMHEPEKSTAMCRKAMPKADKPCGCTLDAKNALQCSAWPRQDGKGDD